MRPTLADSLPLLLAELEPPLVLPATNVALQRTARALAPVPRGGFECRLSALDDQVDLQQCIVRQDGEPTAERPLEIWRALRIQGMSFRLVWRYTCVRKYHRH